MLLRQILQRDAYFDTCQLTCVRMLWFQACLAPVKGTVVLNLNLVRPNRNPPISSVLNLPLMSGTQVATSTSKFRNSCLVDLKKKKKVPPRC